VNDVYPAGAPPGGVGVTEDPESTRPALWVAIGAIAGLLAGLLFGYLLFHKTTKRAPPPRTTPTPTVSASPSPTPSASPSDAPTASPTDTPSPPPTTAQATPPPPPAPAGCSTLPLGPPGDPHVGHRGPDVSGCGSTTLNRFTTGNNWGIGFSYACPNGTAQGGGKVIAFTPVGSPDSSATGVGDSGSGESSTFPTGGTFQLKVDTASTCRWHVVIYTT